MIVTDDVKRLDKVFKWLGIIWSLVVFIVVAAFFFGGEWGKWKEIKTIYETNGFDDVASQQEKVVQLEAEITNLKSRINGIKLEAVDAGKDTFGCGGEGKSEPSTLTVMYGSRDGTSCGIGNINYYKELVLSVPD